MSKEDDPSITYEQSPTWTKDGPLFWVVVKDYIVRILRPGDDDYEKASSNKS